MNGHSHNSTAQEQEILISGQRDCLARSRNALVWELFTSRIWEGGLHFLVCVAFWGALDMLFREPLVHTKILVAIDDLTMFRCPRLQAICTM